MKKKSQKNIIKYVIYVLLLIATAVLIGYSLQQYYGEEAEEGIMVCNDQECIKTVHIHADIEFDLCGQIYELPRETGPLDGLHTHKEKNYLHFHDKLKLDPATKEQQFDQRLTIQEVIDAFQLDPKLFCKGSGEIKTNVLVNAQEPKEGLQYNWQDHDKIQIIYKQ